MPVPFYEKLQFHVTHCTSQQLNHQGVKRLERCTYCPYLLWTRPIYEWIELRFSKRRDFIPFRASAAHQQHWQQAKGLFSFLYRKKLCSRGVFTRKLFQTFIFVWKGSPYPNASQAVVSKESHLLDIVLFKTLYVAIFSTTAADGVHSTIIQAYLCTLWRWCPPDYESQCKPI